MGEGETRTTSGNKRRRGVQDQDDDMENMDEDGRKHTLEMDIRGGRRESKGRRIEAIGQKRITKEVYRQKRKMSADTTQWTT